MKIREKKQFFPKKTIFLIILLIKISSLIAGSIVFFLMSQWFRIKSTPMKAGDNVIEEMMMADDWVYRFMPTVKEVGKRDIIKTNYFRDVNYKDIFIQGKDNLSLYTRDNEGTVCTMVATFINMDGKYSYDYWETDKKLWIKYPFLWDETEANKDRYMRNYNLTDSDIRRMEEKILYKIILKNWFDHTNSTYSIINLGDIEISEVNGYNKAIRPVGERINKEKQADKEKNIKKENKIEMASDRTKNFNEYPKSCNKDVYKIKKSNQGIAFFSKEGISYYNDEYTEAYLNDIGGKNRYKEKWEEQYFDFSDYSILYADDRYLCIWRKNSNGMEEIVLLDLYQTNFQNGSLSVGEGWEYGFRLPMEELKEQIWKGAYSLSEEGYQLIQSNPEEYEKILHNYFNCRQYLYRTYITDKTVGFLIPVNMTERGYIHLEVNYDWKDKLSFYDAGYCPEELDRVYDQNQRWLEEQSKIIKKKSEKTLFEEKIETIIAVCLQNRDLLQTECICIEDIKVQSYKYNLYDAATQEELHLEDIIDLGSEFCQWIKYSGKTEGNLTKGAYSVEEGCEETQQMLRDCPEEKLEEALNGCEFYLEPGLLHLKLPYWNVKAKEPGWVRNGGDKLWKNWLTIRTDDIEAFLKAEKW